jgi:purine-nucleoside phosphorylase
MNDSVYQHVAAATAFVRGEWAVRPRVGIILGTGLGSLADEIDAAASLPYAEIPHFPISTAIGHRGHLVCGRLGDVPVVAMAGRLHAYEGYPLLHATLPVRVMRALGAELLIVSNAAGGLNPYFANGDIMVIEDHINLMRDHPLIGMELLARPEEPPRHGAAASQGRARPPGAARDEPRSLPSPVLAEIGLGHWAGAPWRAAGELMSRFRRPYDPQLFDRSLAIARRLGIRAHRGVYVALTGPNLETRAEYRWLRRIGGDVVGMSTVPEVLAAVHCGLRVLAFSIVSNVCLPDALPQVSIDQIMSTAAQAETRLRRIVLELLRGEA